jgi:hypothetical protein
MRALTMDELSFVSGGKSAPKKETEVVVVTGSLGMRASGFSLASLFGGGGSRVTPTVDIGLELNLDLNDLMDDLDDSVTTVAEMGASVLSQMQTMGQASISKSGYNSWAVVGRDGAGNRFTVTGVGSSINSVTRTNSAGTSRWTPVWSVPNGGFWQPI